MVGISRSQCTCSGQVGGMGTVLMTVYNRMSREDDEDIIDSLVSSMQVITIVLKLKLLYLI